MIVSRIGPLSLAKIAGVLYMSLGLLAGCGVALFSLLGFAATADDTPGGAFFGLLFGIGAIVLFPVLYGTIGFVGSLIMAGLYNVLARVIGGVEIQLDDPSPER